MFCYLKRYKDFKTVCKLEIVDYEFADGKNGSLTVIDEDPSRISEDYVRSWVIVYENDEVLDEVDYSINRSILSLGGGIDYNITGSELFTTTKTLDDGGIEYNIYSYSSVKYKQHIYFVVKAAPSNNLIKLTIANPIYAFDRSIYYLNGAFPETNPDSYEQFIYNTLVNEFGPSEQDFGLQYLQVVNSTTKHTRCYACSNRLGYIVPSVIFEQARYYDIVIDFESTNNVLIATIRNEDFDTGVVLFNDGHSILANETYSKQYYSKLTILKELQDLTDPLAKTNEMRDGPENQEIEQSSNSNVCSSFWVEICQNPYKSFSLSKYSLVARIGIRWGDEYSSHNYDTEFYSDTLLNIRINNGGKTLINKTDISWVRTIEPGSYYTDWFELSPFSEYNVTGFNRLGVILDITARIYGRYSSDGGETIVIPANPETHNLQEQLQLFRLIPPEHIKLGIMGDGEFVHFQEEIYYLKNDGDITQIKPSSENMADGVWGVFENTEYSYCRDMAESIFNENSDGHKIEFYSDYIFKFHQPIKLVIRNKVYDTKIATVSKKNNDNKYYYTCGVLNTTLTDQVSGLSSSIDALKRK